MIQEHEAKYTSCIDSTQRLNMAFNVFVSCIEYQIDHDKYDLNRPYQENN